ncbi:ATP-dependent sacrificial sulfur transferase LarE [Desulfatitalea alkaliphila]|uniref:ATP-dependent sacrificial sulfur transferase LarE n=1 Tax=Desulfatitalea alkaliphila TaxID=2929485 RepID=A0AA41UJG8_9BACT|nr:ATP-dependent sacrificial sulfur transferase LarE [Desulfatitalea alkaliphila]MCJ8500517.1 ATP-dependent sacrificial sulfur transferase LarE [Desulfatitalea alkaliphila]
MDTKAKSTKNSFMPISATTDAKYARLLELLGHCDGLGVAFSGGVDSTLLLAAAKQVLGERVVAFTARSAIHPDSELSLSMELARQLKVEQVVFNTDELQDPLFVANGPLRCYYCKRRLFAIMARQARQVGIHALAHGANLDDAGDYRPGLQAANELGIAAPLMEAGLSKREIRTLAKKMGLPNWDKPAMACLASRVPYDTPISPALLTRIDQAESLVRDVIQGPCRVRHHGSVARIEVEPAVQSELLRPASRRRVVDALRALGYDHVCLDLEGYVAGKMNRGLNPE